MDRIKAVFNPLRWLLPVLVLLAATLIFTQAPARPGGGSSYSGGSHSYSGGSHSYGGSSHSYGGSSHSYGGGGSYSGGGPVGLLFDWPQIVIPIIVIIVLLRIYGVKNAAPEEVISTRSSNETMIWNRRKVDNALIEFRDNVDPGFSQTLFLDFAQRIYNQYHQHRTHAEILDLAPYFEPEIIQNARPRPNFRIDVTELVIGTVDFVNVSMSTGKVHLSVRFDANYTETIAGHSNRWWVQETWFFARQAQLQSPAPSALQAVGCPSCGGTLALTPTGACQHCQAVVTPGDLTWTVEAINIGHREVQRGAAVGTYAPERGTNLPTLFDPRLSATGHIFAERHQLTSITEYAATFKEKVVEPIFTTIYAAWQERSYAAVRPFMSDNLFASHYYWIEAYKKAGLINRLDNLTITGVHLVKLDLDKYYEAATVRIFASVHDYIVTEDGKHYAGVKNSARRYSEYWTFVRRAGIEKDEREYDPHLCPNCGAPVDMGMTGVCNYCHSKVTTGEFGWVLSRITQDEAYYG